MTKNLTKEENKTEAVFLWLSLFLVVPATIFHAFVLTVLWSWFMAPVFDLPDLTKIQAYGISLLLGYVIYKPRQYSSREVFTSLLSRTFLGGYVLLIGFILTKL